MARIVNVEIIHISRNEVIEAHKELKNRKSAGEDDVNNKLLKYGENASTAYNDIQYY